LLKREYKQAVYRYVMPHYRKHETRNMRRMMKNKYKSIMVKLFTLVIGLVLSVTIYGCIDPIVADMEAEHQRLGMIAKQDLQRNLSTSPTDTQMETLFPAP